MASLVFYTTTQAFRNHVRIFGKLAYASRSGSTDRNWQVSIAQAMLDLEAMNFSDGYIEEIANQFADDHNVSRVRKADVDA